MESVWNVILVALLQSYYEVWFISTVECGRTVYQWLNHKQNELLKMLILDACSN